jgi:nitronate monooxygenase
MPLLPLLEGNLRLPVIGAPLFIVSNPELVIAQCKAGIVGAFPALNARPQEALDRWLTRIESELAAHRAAHPGATVAPFAVNQIVHTSNGRLDADLDVCVRHRVPIVITSLRPPHPVVDRVHAYGGIVLHDVISVRHAEKALEAGVDGLILVCTGAGGHAGALSPFALVNEVRRFYAGTLVLAGAITNGAGILAAQAMGCDLAYLGTRFIATQEANAPDPYKQMIAEARAADVLYTPYFSGVHGSYLKASIRAAGLDPENLPDAPAGQMNYDRREARPKAWKDIWSAGQGVGNITDAPTVSELVDRLEREHRAARARIATGKA